MKYYKYTVAFGLSLGVMFLSNYLIGRFSDLGAAWYMTLLKPTFSPAPLVYDIGFLGAFGFAVLCCTFSTVKKELRKTLALWGGICVLSVLWALTLFVWESLYGALGISLAVVIALLVLFRYYQKNTKELWLALLPPIAWNVYLFAYNYGLCMLN